MNLSIHFIVSAILTAIFYPFLGVSSLLIMVGGFLIDIDHLLYYIFKFKKFSIKGAYIIHKFDNRYKFNLNDKLHIFHVGEFQFLLVILSIFYPKLLIIFIGLIPHLIMDFIYCRNRKVLNGRAYSVIMWLKRHSLALWFKRNYSRS